MRGQHRALTGFLAGAIDTQRRHGVAFPIGRLLPSNT
jgi:hypothetical protein